MTTTQRISAAFYLIGALYFSQSAYEAADKEHLIAWVFYTLGAIYGIYIFLEECFGKVKTNV